MKKHDELDPRLASLLEDLKPVPTRDPQAASRARSRFLAQAVSARSAARQSWWTQLFQRKETFTMKLAFLAMLVLGLLFGGGATVGAAKAALPTDSLYQVKLASEGAQLAFTANPISRIELLMEQAQTRTEEMVALSSQGLAPDEALTIRARENIQQALQLTAGLDEGAMTAVLSRISTQLQTQEQLMTQAQTSACAECDPILEQTRDMLRTQLHTAEGGLNDPQAFRNGYRQQNQLRLTQTPGATNTPTPGGTPLPSDTPETSPTPLGSCTPVLDGSGEQQRNGNPQNGTTPVPTREDNWDGNGNQGTPQPTPGGNGNRETPPPTAGNHGNGNLGTPQPTPGGQGGKP